LGLAVWGDDPSTEEIDGLQTGEAFELRWLGTAAYMTPTADQQRHKYHNTKNEKSTELPLITLAIRGDSRLIYKTDDLLVLDVAVESAVPEEFYLSEAYPNPFNAVVRLSYGLPDAAMVSIRVYDVAGRLIETLLDKNRLAGYHTVLWDGSSAASGIYFIGMASGDFKVVRKVMLVK